MNCRADRSIKLVLFLIALSGALLGQTPVPTQKDSALQASDASASLSPSLTAASGKLHDDSFIIGNDDLLAINVWKEQDLSRSIPVRSDGKISLPLVGEVQAAGRTPLQLEQDIASKLRDFITKPEVTVMVQEIHSQKFNIIGQVAKPGSYLLPLAPTIVDAIAIAGGFRDFAKQKSIYILRQKPDGGETRIPFNYKDFTKGKAPNLNVKLEPHDTIVVP
jgi:polysaccharide export outer membrane protein